MLREKFVARFNEALARRIESAALEHHPDDNHGSDPFRWALVICIGFECISNPHYQEYHKISVPWKELKRWIIENADLTSHDGDFDALAAAAGLYNEFIGEANATN